MNKAALLAAKLRGLARAAGVDDLQPVVFPGGAAALGPPPPGGAQSSFEDAAVPSAHFAQPDAVTTLWVLAPTDLGHRALGPALALSARHGWPPVDLLLDEAEAAGVATRRASYFTPEVRVWTIAGTALERARERSSNREDAAEMLPLAALDALAETIESAGAEPVLEHGVLRAEVKGLEVARVVVDDDGIERLAVGVGKHDREAHRMAHEVTDPATALAALVRQISEGRRAGAPSGLASDLARERWLRWVACRRPEIAGARGLIPVDPPDPRPDLRATSIAPARGVTADGDDALFAFSVGVDTNLVPAAADVEPGRRLVLVVPEGDDDGVTSTLAAALREPASIRTVPRNWPAMGDSPA